MAKQLPSNTVPVVEPDIAGGHEPYVRVDSSPVPGAPVLPSAAVSGQPTLVVDRELLAAVQDVLGELREFRLLLLQQLAP